MTAAAPGNHQVALVPSRTGLVTTLRHCGRYVTFNW